jgi:5-methylcytosine-specific restriction endonuclease McrA
LFADDLIASVKVVMSKIQHSEAQRLLPIIYKAVKSDRLLTYTTAASALGRDPKKSARMVAQVCDLLDAAAVLAHVPSLALVAVREISGDINRRAWAGHALRNAIIEKSKNHKFSSEDIAAIKRALEKLEGMGNKLAWAWVRKKMPRDQIYQILAEPELSPGSDAINDLGTDTPSSSIVSGLQYARDPEVRAAVIRRAVGKCEFCRKLGFLRIDGSRYLECHHIIALANDGADRMTNVIALCPDDHRRAHFGAERNVLEQKMIRKVRRLEKRNERSPN